MVPDQHRWLARLSRRCPSCREDHLEMPAKYIQKAVRIESGEGKGLWRKVRDGEEGVDVEAAWCDICGLVAIDDVDANYLVSYPWGKVRGSHILQEKARKYRQRITTKMCKI